MTAVQKLISSSAAIFIIAAAIVLTFTLVRHADGDVPAEPVVTGVPNAE